MSKQLVLPVRPVRPLEYDSKTGEYSEPVEPSLFEAAYRGHVSKILNIIKKNPKSAIRQDCVGKTALHNAVMRHENEALKLLIYQGHAKLPIQELKPENIVNILPENKFSLLHEAVYHGNIEAIEILIKAGSRLDVKDKLGQTVLHHAVFRSSLEVIKTIREAGSPVDSRDNEGLTPMMEAIRPRSTWTNDTHESKYCEIVKYLLDSGANKEIKDNLGRTAWIHAKYNGYPKIIEVLESYIPVPVPVKCVPVPVPVKCVPNPGPIMLYVPIPTERIPMTPNPNPSPIKLSKKPPVNESEELFKDSFEYEFGIFDLLIQDYKTEQWEFHDPSANLTAVWKVIRGIFNELLDDKVFVEAIDVTKLYNKYEQEIEDLSYRMGEKLEKFIKKNGVNGMNWMDAVKPRPDRDGLKSDCPTIPVGADSEEIEEIEASGESRADRTPDELSKLEELRNKFVEFIETFNFGNEFNRRLGLLDDALQEANNAEFNEHAIIILKDIIRDEFGDILHDYSYHIRDLKAQRDVFDFCQEQMNELATEFANMDEERSDEDE